MTPQEVLAKAAEVMAERGKSNGCYESNGEHAATFGEKGSVCAYGAMTLAATDMRTSEFSELGMKFGGSVDWFERKELVNQAAALLARRVTNPHADLTSFSTVTRFSDNSSAEDVILAMKRAAHE